MVIVLGESCGQGTLIKLRQRIEEKGFDYVCYDVFGDPQNATQNLTACAMGIISSVQQGVCVSSCAGVCVFVGVCVRVSRCVCVCLHVCVCVFAYVHACMYAYVHTYMCVLFPCWYI